MDAAQDPKIVDLYTLISTNPMYLEESDGIPFAETPLHKAASEGHTRVAVEILRLKPSQGKKLNLEGLSPMDLALRNGHESTVEGLIRCDSELIRVQGRGGITPLHYVVETENIYLLIKFLLECPASIRDRTVRYESAMHIAVRKQKLRALKVLLGWLERTDNLQRLRLKDDRGNTVMHLAALTNQLEVIKLLMGKASVNYKNSEGLTALDLIAQGNEEARKLLRSNGGRNGSRVKDPALEDYFSSPQTFGESPRRIYFNLQNSISGDMRNAMLVVAALIATATYQAALTPPGGFVTNYHLDGTLYSPNINRENETSALINGNITMIGGTDTKGLDGPKSAVIAWNTMSFGIAMAACLFLTSETNISHLLVPVILFSVSYAVLAGGILEIGMSAILLLLAFLGLPVALLTVWHLQKVFLTPLMISRSRESADYAVPSRLWFGADIHLLQKAMHL